MTEQQAPGEIDGTVGCIADVCLLPILYIFLVFPDRWGLAFSWLISAAICFAVFRKRVVTPGRLRFLLIFLAFTTLPAVGMLYWFVPGWWLEALLVLLPFAAMWAAYWALCDGRSGPGRIHPGLAAFAALWAAFVVWGAPARVYFPNARMLSLASEDQENLISVGYALRMYADDYDGAYPPTAGWQHVLQPYTHSEDVFRRIWAGFPYDSQDPRAFYPYHAPPTGSDPDKVVVISDADWDSLFGVHFDVYASGRVERRLLWSQWRYIVSGQIPVLPLLDGTSKSTL